MPHQQGSVPRFDRRPAPLLCLCHLSTSGGADVTFLWQLARHSGSQASARAFRWATATLPSTTKSIDGSVKPVALLNQETHNLLYGHLKKRTRFLHERQQTIHLVVRVTRIAHYLPEAVGQDGILRPVANRPFYGSHTACARCQPSRSLPNRATNTALITLRNSDADH